MPAQGLGLSCGAQPALSLLAWDKDSHPDRALTKDQSVPGKEWQACWDLTFSWAHQELMDLAHLRAHACLSGRGDTGPRLAHSAPWCLLPAESMGQQQQDVVADLGGGRGQGWGAWSHVRLFG